jgi:hypothetical protein
MKGILIPADPKEEATEVEFDNDNPYEFGKHFVGDWTEKVRTPFPDIYIMVDDSGHLKGLDRNPRATALFYPFPPGIAGAAVVVRIERGGPEEWVADMEATQFNAFLRTLNLSLDI